MNEEIAKKTDLGGLVNLESFHQIQFEENNGHLTARMKLPGMDEGDIVVNTENNQIHIYAERVIRETVNQGCYKAYKNSTKSIEATRGLPYGIAPESVSSTYKNGILEVEMEKL